MAVSWWQWQRGVAYMRSNLEARGNSPAPVTQACLSGQWRKVARLERTASTAS